MSENCDNYKGRSLEGFRKIYLTIISIIQGVALGILVNNIFYLGIDKKIANPDCFLLIKFQFILNIFNSFFLIIIVSYSYSLLVLFYQWSVRSRDIIIPFLVGFWEICPTYFLIDVQKWWFCVGIFCFIGAIAYSNSLRASRENNDEKLKNKIKNKQKFNIVYSIVSGGYCFIVYYCIYRSSLNKYIPIMLSVIFLILCIILLYSSDRFSKDAEKDYA